MKFYYHPGACSPDHIAPDWTDETRDIANASVIENGTDESERRTCLLLEASRRGGDSSGH